MKSYGVTIQMKATEQYFPVVLLIMLYKMVPTSKSVAEILWCDHLNETSLPELKHGTLYFFGFYQNEFYVFCEFSWSLSGLKGLGADSGLYFIKNCPSCFLFYMKQQFKLILCSVFSPCRR